MTPCTIVQVIEAAAGIPPEKWTPPAPVLIARFVRRIVRIIERGEFSMWRCDPEAALHAEMVEETRLAEEEYQRAEDLAHPQTRCDVCQEVWEHGLVPCGGELLCDPCVAAVAV